MDLRGLFSQIDEQELEKELKEQEEFESRDFSIKPGLYNAKLERIRYEKAKESNALAIVFDYKLNSGANFSERKWITDRNGNIMYSRKDEETGVIVKKYLPGYLQAISLAKMHGLIPKELEDIIEANANIYGENRQIVMVNPYNIKQHMIKLVLRKEEYVDRNTGEFKQKDVIHKAFHFDTPDDDEKLQKAVKFVTENPIKEAKNKNAKSIESKELSAEAKEMF